MTDLNLLIIGAGAIGTYIGGSLLLNGQRVVFLDRPGTADSIAAAGMKLVIDGQTRVIDHPVVIESLPESLQKGPFDAALVAVKSYDTPTLAEQLSLFKGQMPPILCMQNGVENEEVYSTALGPDRVIAGTLTSAIGKPAYGTAVLEKLRGIGIADQQEVSKKIVEGFNQAGLQARLYADAKSMKWSKLVTNLLANASSAILDMPPSEIYSHPGLYEMEARQIREALEVMRRLGLQVVDLPGTPVRLLALLMQFVPTWIGRRLSVRLLSRGRGGKMPSFHIDLHSGRGQTEVDFLNGAVVRFGEQFGVQTPVNRMLAVTLQQLTNGSQPLDSYRGQAEKLLDHLKIY
ncbi:MAG: ketopantoate reductase family protein [Bellilinea sp.]